MSVSEMMVDAEIAGKKVKIFSKSTSPFCTKAKKLMQKYLGDLSEDYKVMDIERILSARYMTISWSKQKEDLCRVWF